MSKSKKLVDACSYRAAGVDLDRGDELVSIITPLGQATHRNEVLNGIGGFAALFEMPRKFHEPILVSGTDGVGTKLKIALEMNQHQTIGIDLVAMCVNDILTQGAEPLFFLDYFASGILDVQVAKDVVSGIANACRLAGCALIGGETAEMPGMYVGGEYDLAGFVVGAVEKSKMITGKNIEQGDCVLGIASNGLHANGFSLVRKIIYDKSIALNQRFSDDELRTLGDVLLEPTRIYAPTILKLLQQISVKGIAHITGGGLIGNVPRILPAGLAVELNVENWTRQPIFDWLQEQGGMSDNEMHHVFNCGIGMTIIVAQSDLEKSIRILKDCGEEVWHIGWVVDYPEQENYKDRVRFIHKR